MRRLALALIVFAAVLGGCGGDEKPEDVVSAYLSALTEGDAEAACDRLTGQAAREAIDWVRASLPEVGATTCPEALAALAGNLGEDEKRTLENSSATSTDINGDTAKVEMETGSAAELQRTDGQWYVANALLEAPAVEGGLVDAFESESAPSASETKADPGLAEELDEPIDEPQDAVAVVEDEPITMEQFVHWMDISVTADGPPIPADGSRRWRRLRDQVMEFLITSVWIEHEAQRQGVVVSDADVDRRFQEQKDSGFDTDAAYEEYLRTNNLTEEDVHYRLRIELLSESLRDAATQGAATQPEQQEALDAFLEEFQSFWPQQTACADAYRVSQCGA